MKLRLRPWNALLLTAPFLLAFQSVPGVLQIDPPSFVPNEGQWESEALYVARGRDWVCAVEPAGFVFGFEPESPGSGHAVRIVAAGSRSARAVVGDDQVATQHSFLLGNDPSRWRLGLPGFREVRYQELFEGIDLVLETGSEAPISYRIEVSGGADIGSIEFRIEGALGMAVDSEGALRIQTPAGELIQTAPRAWEGSLDGREVGCRFALRAGERCGFDVDSGAGPLVIDPGVLWSTYMAGSQFDTISAIALDPDSGSLAFAGITLSSDFPATSGSYGGIAPDAFFGLRDLASGSLLSLVLLGGWGDDEASGVDYNGERIAIVGSTTSPNFPVTSGAFDTQYGGGGSDAFVAVFPEEPGAGPIYVTFLGTNELDDSYDVALDAEGRATAVGRTESDFFPVTQGAVDPVHGNLDEGFVTQLRANGKGLVFSTFYGGSEGEWIRSVDRGPDGSIAIAGFTMSPDLPISPGAFQPSLARSQDAFVAKLSGDGTSLLLGTYLGGALGASDALAVQSHVSGDVFVSGLTVATDFPTTPGAFETSKVSSSDITGFVSRVASDGTSLVFSTYTKDTPGDVRCWDLAVDASGVATVVAQGAGPSWPVTPGAGPYAPLDGSDVGLFRLRPDGTGVLYSTAIGGAGLEAPNAVEITSAGTVLFSGFSTSSDFPGNPGSHQGGGDAFLAALDPYPAGISSYGAPTDACLGPVLMNVTTMPAPGAPFSFTCSAAPPNSVGGLLWGLGQDLGGTPFLGAKVHVALTAFFHLVPLVTSAEGWAEVAFALPPSAVGATGYAQFGWLNTATCGGPGMLSASNALSFTVQP